MAVKLKTAQDIPQILREMTIEEKAALLTGATNYGTKAIERFGIPNSLWIDNGCGVNLRQYIQELLSRGTLRFEGANMPSNTSYLMDQIKHRENITPEENKLLDDFLDYLRRHFVKSGELPSCFPVNSLLASTWDRDIVLAVARQVGKEASALGVDVLLGTPCVNIQRDPRGGRGFECWSEDPFLTGELAKQYPVGVQESGVAADLKHFAINNQETNRRTINVTVSERAAREIYLAAFRRIVKESGVKTVMTSYNAINGTAASENKWLLQDILRNEWGFDGTVVSDWGGVYHRVPSLEAGNDLCMPQRLSPQILVDAVQNGTLQEETLDRSCSRILHLLLTLPCMQGRKYTEIDAKEAEKVAYDAAAGGIVLLKNDGVLPLTKESVVSFLDEKNGQLQDCGIGSGRVHTDKTSNLFDCAKAIAGENVLCNTVSGRTEAVVVTIAAHGQEGADRADISLDDAAKAALKAAIASAKKINAKVVLLLNIAAPVDLTDYIDDLAAVLCLYFPGEQGAHATADILYGLVNPGGKLAQTFPRRYTDCPSSLNFPGEYNEVHYGEGIFVGYRYYDAKNIEPLFPFGHGLSYTTFSFDRMQAVEEWQIEKEDCISVSVRVTNTGKTAGAEVVQLYLSDLRSTQPKPPQELKGFAKVFLQPGESETVTLSLSREDIASFDETYGWVVEPGLYELRLGNSSRNILCKKAVRVRGFNPYGYGKNTVYANILRDPRAIDTINRTLPAPILDDAELKKETNYLDTNLTFNGAIDRYYLPHFSLSDEQREALFRALGEIDVTETEQRYEEANMD